MPGLWDDIYGTLSDYGSRALKLAATPLLPEHSFDGDEDTTNTAADRVYNQFLRYYSSPLNLLALTPVGARAARGVSRLATGKMAQGLADLNEARYPAMLSHPITPVKAGLGTTAAVLTNAAEHASEGNYGSAGKVLSEYFNPIKYTKNFAKGFVDRTPIGRVPTHIPTNPTVVDQILSVPGRFMNAVDRPAIEAAKAAGTDIEHMRNLQLSGTPITQSGREIVKAFENAPILSYLASAFPRVGVHMFEQPFSSPQKALTSLLLGGAAYEASDKIPDEYSPLVGSAAGPFNLPVAIGLAAGHVSGKGAKATQSAIIDELRSNSPVPSFETPTPAGIVGQFAPNILSGFARANDPYERSTRGTLFGAVEKKIPGLREQLPTQGRKRDAFGQDISGRGKSAFKRFWLGEPYRYDVTPNDIPELAELDRLGVKVKAPSYSKEISVQGHKIPLNPENAEQYQEEQRAMMQPFLKAFEESDIYQSLDDEQKKIVIAEAWKRAQAANMKYAKGRALRRALGEQ